MNINPELISVNVNEIIPCKSTHTHIHINGSVLNDEIDLIAIIKYRPFVVHSWNFSKCTNKKFVHNTFIFFFIPSYHLTMRVICNKIHVKRSPKLAHPHSICCLAAKISEWSSLVQFNYTDKSHKRNTLSQKLEINFAIWICCNQERCTCS